jgi:hypothetical protein
VIVVVATMSAAAPQTPRKFGPLDADAIARRPV